MSLFIGEVGASYKSNMNIHPFVYPNVFMIDGNVNEGDFAVVLAGDRPVAHARPICCEVVHSGETVSISYGIKSHKQRIFFEGKLIHD